MKQVFSQAAHFAIGFAFAFTATATGAHWGAGLGLGFGAGALREGGEILRNHQDGQRWPYGRLVLGVPDFVWDQAFFTLGSIAGTVVGVLARR